MKFMVELDSEKNPDAVGEYLRSEFFDEGKWDFEEQESEKVGCVSSFDWRPEVQPLPELPVCTEDEYNYYVFEDLKWTRGEKQFVNQTIECRYFWDGDGTLVFCLPEGKYLINADCKKSHGWELTDHLDY